MNPTTGRPPLLFISPLMPAIGGNGLAMRMGVFLEAYARRFAVTLVTAPVSGQQDGGEPTSFVLRHAERVIALPLDRALHPLFQIIARHRDPVARRAALRAYPRPRPLYYDPIVLRETMAEQLGGARNFALVHVGRLYMAPLAEAYLGRTRTILDLDEDDARTMRRIGALQAANGDGVASEDDEADAAKYEKLAGDYLPRFELSLVASEAEKANLQSRHPGACIAVIENAIRPPAAGAGDPVSPLDLLMVGSLGYYPNVDGALFFCREIFPRLSPVSLTIVGRRPAASITALGQQPGISIAPNVADPAPYYRAARVAVVPIRAGGGSRIKILEAFAHGLPVVSTSMGAEGLAVTQGRHLLIADAPEDFAAAVKRLLADRGLAARLAAAGRALIAERYDLDRVAGRIETLADGTCRWPGRHD
jgi:glycosyltransferase involved in cell wall biosynthesis